MVLDDGETYSSLDGCRIVTVAEGDLVRLDSGETVADLIADGTATVVTTFR